MRTVRRRNTNKKYGLWIIAGVELCAMAGVYINGAYGFRAQQIIAAESKMLVDEIDIIQHEIALFKKEITLWQAYPFYKEKAAREQLQMCYPDEIIYVTRPHTSVGVDNV
ncbi:hypothetical protein Noda2021_06980 [Candidatus Dependentiae bacterium Noda2021]|nr:hypothetical protein Noda2021_06980 [Candidatus Dependentiae bacterium Noda2021]